MAAIWARTLDGLKVGKASRGRFAARVRELVADRARLRAVTEPMLKARAAVRAEFDRLHRMVLEVVHASARWYKTLCAFIHANDLLAFGAGNARLSGVSRNFPDGSSRLPTDGSTKAFHHVSGRVQKSACG